MAGEARQALERQFAPGQKSRAAILEVPATDGMLDKPGTVKVTVERFGHERAGDSMFERYDDKCAEQVLRAFRFSPLFLGKSADFNFATAYASYLAAGEPGVRGRERRLFDEIVTRKLLPALGGGGYVFRSNPIAIKDVTQQIAALALAAGLPGIDLESVVDQLNKAAELELQFRCSDSRRFWVAAKDKAGNYSTPASARLERIGRDLRHQPHRAGDRQQRAAALGTGDVRAAH